MKLLVTGATGLIGKNLITHAKRRKISIHFLTTRKGECINSDGLKGFFWNPEQDEIDDMQVILDYEKIRVNVEKQIRNLFKSHFSEDK